MITEETIIFEQASDNPGEPLLSEALSLQEAKRFQDADKVYQRLAREHPTFSDGLFHYARMLHSFPHIPEAMQKAAKMYDRATKGIGDSALKAEAHNALGIIMLAWGHEKLAAGCFQSALALNPSHANALVNLGIAYRIAGDLTEAEREQAAVIARDPNCPEAHFERAFIRLTLGDLKTGFEEYEWRWKCPQFISARMDDLGIPLWAGESLDGKSIILPYEQGFGDAIMFVRYARLIKDRWPAARVCAWVTPELVRLIGCADGVDKAFNSHEPIPDTFDFYCPMISLARVFQTTLETVPSEPYIKVPWIPYASIPSFRVGIVWAGRPEHGGDRWRSTQLAEWKDVLSVDGVQFYSFQMWKAKEQLAEAPNVIDATRDVVDFLHTAQRLHDMDLLISVDTAIVHLSGAMGKEVWTLLPFSPDWRWMLSGDKSPWYPTMKLFRQEQRGDWSPVFARVRAELERKVNNHGTAST